jgi:hypothetical protein
MAATRHAKSGPLIPDTTTSLALTAALADPKTPRCPRKSLDSVPDGNRTMADRESIKVMVMP